MKRALVKKKQEKSTKREKKIRAKKSIKREKKS
jgi:hypothetical protein